jgi:hypothetical protein
MLIKLPNPNDIGLEYVSSKASFSENFEGFTDLNLS